MTCPTQMTHSRVTQPRTIIVNVSCSKTKPEDEDEPEDEEPEGPSRGARDDDLLPFDTPDS